MKIISLLVMAFIASWAVVSVGDLAQADEIVPESHHHQYQTYSIFTDEQSSILFRSAGRGWLEIGGAIAVYQIDVINTQLVVHGSASAGLRLNQNGNTLLTETVDARAGLSLDHPFTDTFRGTVGWTHESGHAADDIQDMALFGSNLGNEQLYARVIYDWNRMMRLGGSLKPYVGTDPGLKWFAADQFAEYYPLGVAENVHKPTWYVATSISEYGHNAVYGTVNAQTGVFFGSHLDPDHHSGIRAAIGYYGGVDPRLKYMEFLNGFSKFFYAGLLADF
jgi:hypothetical protein